LNALESGDSTQLPVMALKGEIRGAKRAPQVVFERPNPNQIVAIVTQYGFPSGKGIRYRIEMTKTTSPCACQQWRISWAGKQQL
jgi:hypothetical protein